MTEQNLSHESDFYTTLIEEYNCVRNDSEKLVLLKSNKIREITEIFSKNHDTGFFQEAMQILLSLFNDNCVLFESTSKDFEELSKEKKDYVTYLLSQE
ncbi:MAG: hypothetical protein EU548_08780 [Promethearchaeota archaeon]|nr:MAG: hypothetical protein EU548_08780 [Candidatus Lokiarchaeota archaeon]